MPAPSGDRARWILDLCRRQAELQDAFVAGNDYDALWGEVEDAHRTFVERFLAMLPPGGRVLDAACGTGKYFPMVLARGRSVLGVDQSAAMLAVARAKFPHVPTEQLEEKEGPWHEGGYAYHHVLGRGRDGVVQAPPSAQATGPDSTT